MIVLVVFLMQVGVGAVVMHFLREPYNPGFARHPGVTLMHVVLGGLFVVVAPFQFVTSIRRRWPSYHRWAGRVMVLVGAVIGVTAIFMAVVIPFSGNPERVINGGFGAFFLICLWKAVAAIRRREVRLHQQWMTRTLAMGLAPATMRLLFIPAVVFLDPTGSDVATLATISIVAFSVAFPLHLLVAELWIRTRQGGTGS